MSRLLVLDTHVWVWYVFRELRRGQRAVLREIENAHARGNLYISAFSTWEVGMLESKGRLELGMECMDWVTQALERSGVRVVPLSPEIAVASTRLPGAFRGDPADHIIIATARHMGARLVTADEGIKAFGAQGFVEVLPI